MRLNNVENCMYETVIALIKLTKVRDKVMLYGLLWYNAKIHGFGPCTNGIIFLSGKISDVKKISHAFLDFSELENALEMRGRQMTEHLAFTRPLHDEYLNN